MKAPAPSLLVSVPVAAASAYYVPIAVWEGLRPALLPALSVIAAAVLVRLARGLPFTNADHFSLSDFRETKRKLTAIAEKLRTMMAVCLFAIVALIVLPSALGAMAVALVEYPRVLSVVDGVMSALIAAATSYAFVRIMEVVQIDVALLRLQASVLEGAIAAKSAKAFEPTVAAAKPGTIVGSSSFGRPLQ